MEFKLDPSQREVKDKLAAVFGETGVAEISAMDSADLRALKDLILKQLGRLSEAGYLKLAVGPKGNKDLLSLVAAHEEVAAISSSLFLSVETSARFFGGLLAGWGGDDLPIDILQSIQDGRALGAVAVTEPGGAEPQVGLRTKATKQGDGFVLNGEKAFVTNGPIADWIAVAADLDGKNGFFLVKAGQKGLTVGERMATLGYDGLAVSGLALKDVKVPATHVLGPFDDAQADDFLNDIHDMVLVMASVGLMRRVFYAAKEHAQSFYRGAKPAMAHQDVRFRFSDMFTLLQTSQFLAYRAAWFKAQGDKEGTTLIHCAKVFSAEAAEKVSSLGLQAMAAQGYKAGNPVERGFRDAKFAGISGTTTEVARMNIADQMLKLFAV